MYSRTKRALPTLQKVQHMCKDLLVFLTQLPNVDAEVLAVHGVFPNRKRLHHSARLRSLHASHLQAGVDHEQSIPVPDL